MKNRLLCVLAFAFVFAAAAHADDYSFKEPFTRTAPFKASGKVSLENINGEISIRTWDKNEILIEGEKSAKTEEELKLIDLKIDVSENDAAITVRLPKRSGGFFGNSIRASVRFALTVPVTAVLDKIETVNSGVTIDGVRGSVHASSVNGGIRATGLGADANLRSVNGAVHATFATVQADQQLTFKTVNGSVHVGLPKDAGVKFHASVVNGNIDCDFPLTLGGKVHSRNLAGTIGDGRASREAGSVNGSVHLEAL